jgi:hypothetical protein
MGNSSGKPDLTHEQSDIKYLGDRFPFGDSELLRLYRCYVALQQRPPDEKTTFLRDWAVSGIVLAPGEANDSDNLQALREKRSIQMQIVESEILPAGFGEKLERVAFLRPADRKSSPAEQQEEDEYTRMARLDTFFDGLANCGSRGGRAALGTLFQACVEGDTHPASSKDLVDKDGNEIKARVIDVLNLAYRMSLATAFLRASEDDQEGLLPDNAASSSSAASAESMALNSLASSCVDHVCRQRIRRSVAVDDMDDSDLDLGYCSKMDFLEWSEATAPLLSTILPTFMHGLLFPEKPYPPSRTPFAFPRLNHESAFFSKSNSTMLFSFASMSKSLGGEWHRLYTSVSDGLSFNRLQNSMLGYDGPTLIVIQATNGGIFGAFTASIWKESKDYYGNSDCFLYQLQPLTAVYRPSGNGRNYMYCNSYARSRGYDKMPHGLGFGGSTNGESPRLFIAESFDGCIAGSQDLTFEKGPLLPKNGDSVDKTFDIDHLEVWGCGGDDVVAGALQARSRQRQLRASHIDKARKVDKAAFLNDFRSGLIESKAFKHRNEIHGSTRHHMEENDKKGYEYEK